MRPGDIYPANIVETVISLFIIIIGLIFFGLLLGSIASSLQVPGPTSCLSRLDQLD